MAEKYVVGVDFGTTGTKSVIYDLQGKEIGQCYYNTTTTYPRPGWYSQDASDIVEKSFMSVKGAIKNANIDAKKIVGVSFTHICTSFVPVDKDGNYLYNILLWCDMRGAEMFPYIRECWEKAGITEKDDYEMTGFPLGTLPTLSKVLWFRKHYPELWEKTHKIIGMHAMLTKAFTGEVYYDDRPGIAYSKLANASTFEFEPKWAAMYDLDLAMYAERVDTGTFCGKIPKDVAEKTGLPEGTPIFAGAGDQRCACTGAGVVNDGMMSLCLGTAGVVHSYSSKSVRHKDGKIQILGHCKPRKWQIEANSSSAASSIEWFKEHFCQLESANANLMGTSVFGALTDLAMRSPVGSKGLMYTAWMAGADCPRFNYDARATFTGLTFNHTKSDMIRAIMEGVSLEIYSMILGIEETIEQEVKLVRVTGGGAKSDFWNQIQADVYNKTIETIVSEEATSLGAAMCAAVGLGEYKDLDEAAKAMVKVNKHFEPIKENVKIYSELFGLYNDLFESLKPSFFPGLNKFQHTYVPEA
jgi:xylulokinase